MYQSPKNNELGKSYTFPVRELDFNAVKLFSFHAILIIKIQFPSSNTACKFNIRVIPYRLVFDNYCGKLIMETLSLNIKGMTCGGCVKSITNVLQQLPGISSVNVSLEQNNAVINYDPTKVKPAQFKAAIEDAGFDVV